jgi:hypothetical protein
MRRFIVIALAGASLGGCSSFSWDMFKPTPPTLQLQLESVPPGAEARTSLGPACKTPCSLVIPAPDNNFSVSYTLDKFQSATLPVQAVRNPGDFFTPASTTIDPNPVVAALQPVVAPKAKRKKLSRPKQPKNPKDTAAASAPAASPFPEPTQPLQPAPRLR